MAPRKDATGCSTNGISSSGDGYLLALRTISGVPAWRAAAIAVRRVNRASRSGDQHHHIGSAEVLRCLIVSLGNPFEVTRMAPSLDVRTAPSILVVDDQPTVRRMAHRLLSEWGFRVFEAESGEEAMEVLETARAGIQLVIVDVVMPLSDGVQVTRRIQARWPGQRILYMSAHPAEVLARYGLAELDVPFLAKPFTRDELLNKVSAALEKSAATMPRQPR
jgi:CheY-like chemotaxis protein